MLLYIGCFLRCFDLLLIIWNCYLSKNYLELLLAEKPLEGFHVVVDAGNGAGGFFAVSFHCNLISLLIGWRQIYIDSVLHITA